MPGGDRTGPWGMGARTGRKAGFCSGYSRPGFMNRFAAFPFGGRWFGRFAGQRAGRFPWFRRHRMFGRRSGRL